MSSLKITDTLESLALIINNHSGLMNVSVEDLKMFAGRTCKAYIGYSNNVDDALETLCRKVDPGDIQAIIIFAWTSNNVIRDAHIIEDFVEECSSMYEFSIKWGINRVGKKTGAKLLALYSTEKAVPNQTAEKPYEVEESFAYRRMMLPLGIDVTLEKGKIDWEFFK